MLIALVLMTVSYRALQRPQEQGRIGAWTMVTGGIAALLMAMLTQPIDTNGSAWLEPEQVGWLLAILIGALLLANPAVKKKIEWKSTGDET
jgi:hypothetical protein